MRTMLRCLLLLVALAASAQAEVALPADAAPCLKWASRDLAEALAAAHMDQAHVNVAIQPGLPAEGFDIKAIDGVILVRGADANGCMYGCQELAERIAAAAGASWPKFAAELKPISQKPAIEFRADNFYCHVRPLLFNDVEMWRRYIDMLARNRFNAIDIHGGYDLDDTEFPNLYPLMIHVAQYPGIGNAAEQAVALENFRQIVRHARDRGVQLSLMNYGAEVKELAREQWSDYTSQAVAELLRQVPELKMIGFRVGESLASADFYREAYLKGIELSGRKDVRVYTRTWKTDRDDLEKIGQALPGRIDLEIKYNGEQLGLPYHAMHGTHNGNEYGSYSYQDYIYPNAPYRIIWQVRANGTHRYFAWADTAFIRRTVRTLNFGNARGFSLEPHVAYFSTRPQDYFRSPEDQQTYAYIWEKHWMWYLAWGRIAYNPDLPESVLTQHYVQRLGQGGAAVYRAMQSSGPIVPAIMAYRFQGPDQRHFSPETETGCVNDEDPERSFMALEPMDTRNFCSIADHVANRIAGRSDGRVGPVDVSHLLTASAAKTLADIQAVPAFTGRAAAEWKLLKTDLLATAELGEYYAERIDGAVYACYALKSGSEKDFAAATKLLEQSRATWKKLSDITDKSFCPLNNPLRAQRKFQWSRQMKQLEETDLTLLPELWSERKPIPTAIPLTLETPKPAPMKLAGVRCVIAGTQVTVTVRPDGNMDAAKLWYKPLPSDLLWQSIEMQRGDGGNFSADLPLDARGALYQIEAHRGNDASIFPNVMVARPYWIIEPCSGDRPNCERDETLDP